MINPDKLRGNDESDKININIRVSPIQVSKADFLLIQFPNYVEPKAVNRIRDVLLDFFERHKIDLPFFFLNEDMNVIAMETNGLDELKSTLKSKPEPVECSKCGSNYTTAFVYEDSENETYCMSCFMEKEREMMYEPIDIEPNSSEIYTGIKKEPESDGTYDLREEHIHQWTRYFGTRMYKCFTCDATKFVEVEDD